MCFNVCRVIRVRLPRVRNVSAMDAPIGRMTGAAAGAVTGSTANSATTGASEGGAVTVAISQPVS